MNSNLQRLEDQCKLPVCIFNCCNSDGRCPVSIGNDIDIQSSAQKVQQVKFGLMS